MTAQRVTVAGDTLTLDVAQTCIGRYCSSPATRWEPDPSRPVPLSSTAFEFFADAYRSYDCVPSAEGRDLTTLDLLVAAGIGAGLDQGVVDAVLGALEPLNEALRAIGDPAPVFWELGEDELFGDGGLAVKDGAMWTAWAVLMNLRGVTMLQAHAILHHKLPTVFPLLDKRTVGHFNRRSQAWQETHTDLVRDAEAWQVLEDWHRDTVAVRSHAGSVPLNRLRLHAILLDTRTV